MPAYQRWGSFPQSRMSLTPPEHRTAYMTPMSAVSPDELSNFYHQSYAPQHAREFGDREFGDRFQSNGFGHASHGRSKQISMSQEYPVGYPQPMPAPYHYGPIAAPILPPIRVPEELPSFPQHYTHALAEQKTKEEKPTGGVAQVLDYEMDLMSSFVAEVSQRIVAKNSAPTPQFRKYVSQILSSTRLPSSTIMLGLFYLQERMKILSCRGQDTTSSGTVYRMLTTCLLLGSKFLDDNTFQNRSWAEVSSIAVGELNTMELDWLKDFNWEIHRLMYDNEDGFYTWREHWKTYEEKAHLAKVKELQKLAPIETNFTRSHATPQPLMSPEGPIPAQYQQGPQYDTKWVHPYIAEYSPPSAPDSGPNTPEYYGSSWAYPQPQSYARSQWNPTAASFGPSRGPLPSLHAPYPTQLYGYTTWAGHGANCGCSLCSKRSDYYFNHSAFGVQSVAG